MGSFQHATIFNPSYMLKCTTFTDGDYEKSNMLKGEINVLLLLYYIDKPFINVIKEAIKQSDLKISTYVLPPSRTFSKENINKVKEVLELAKKGKSLIKKSNDYIKNRCF